MQRIHLDLGVRNQKNTQMVSAKMVLSFMNAKGQLHTYANVKNALANSGDGT